MPWVKRTTRTIPTLSSRTSTLEVNDYSKGYNSFISNDRMQVKSGDANLWRLAQSARISTLGEYTNRKGVDFHSVPAGQTQDQAITSTTGASDNSFSETIRLAQVFTAGTTGRLTRIDLNLKNPNGTTGTVLVELWSNVSGAPGTLLAKSSISASDITSSYQYLTARFVNARTVTATTDYWIVAYIQSAGTGTYNWSGTTSATTALSSIDGGVSWASTTYALNFKQYYSTTGGVIGLHRAYKSDGTKVTLFVHGTTLYSVNNTTGALTTVKSGLSASATDYSFVTVNDIVYYVNGYDGLRKWDFTTESQVNSTNYTIITTHKGLLVLVSKDDPNRIVYSNFGDYETFTSTDFILVPAPKTGDPIVALESLNGYLIIPTLNNKHILSGDDNATFSLDEAPDQKGTYTQHTITKDNNFIYYLSDDGVYRSNGSQPQIMSSDVYDDIVNLPNKDTAVMVINRGRLYLWYTPSGEANNSACYVFSLNFGDNGGTTESFDTKSYVSRAFSGFRDTDNLLVASSRVGQVFWQEKDSNDNTNLGDDIDFELRTHYMTGASPAVLKEVRDWMPRFGAQSGNYSITAEYATDLRDNWQTYDTPNVQGAGSTYGSGLTYGSGVTYGHTAEIQSNFYIPGEYRRFAIRYKHYATRQPQKFLGHTLVIQTRRIK